MENIDDFMQRKFDSDDPAERFPFREEYWEQAQALIEAEEQRRRKRRRFLFWWFCCGLLIGAGGLWLWFGRPEQANNMASNKAMEPSGIVSAEPAGVERTQPGNGNNQAAVTPPAQPGTTPESGLNKSPKSAENQTDRLGSKASKPGSETPSVTSGRNNPDRSVKQPVRNTQKTKTGNLPNTSASRALPDFSSTGNKTATPEIAATQGSKTNPVASDIADALQINASAPSSGDSIAALDFTATTAAKSIALLEILELPFPPVSHKRGKLLLKKLPKQFAAEIKPVQDQRITIGAGIAISSWKAGAGYTAGAFASYPLSAEWSLGAGLQLRYVPLATVDAEPDSSENISVQYRYSFGYERTEFRRTTVGLHYVELPLAVRWQHGRLGIEAGVAPGVLILAKDRITQTRESSLGGIEKLADRFESGDKARYRRGNFSTFAMAEWRVVSRLGLTLRGNYRPASLLKPVENVTPEKDAWGLDLGLRWRF